MRNLFDLNGRVALITGGNGGLGLGIARGLASAGANVAVIGRNAEKTREAASAIEREGSAKALPVTADVREPDAVERAVAQTIAAFGRLDILVNNAGIIIRNRPEATKLEDWNAVMSANVTSAFLMSQAVYPALKAAGGGKIINIGSMASLFGSAYACSYAASKGAIVQLTKSLALAWAGDHIQVNAILPGWFETEMTDGAKLQVPGLNERVLGRTPAGRWAKPIDIAGTSVWLASSASDFVTGIAVPVDGGYSCAL